MNTPHAASEPSSQAKELNAQTAAESMPPAKGPQIQFLDGTSHNFGSIAGSGLVEWAFPFTNSGNAPLLIQGAISSSGWLVPEAPQSPIEAGQKSILKVVLNPEGKTGSINATIRVLSNTGPLNNGETILAVSGVVQPAS